MPTIQSRATCDCVHRSTDRDRRKMSHVTAVAASTAAMRASARSTRRDDERLPTCVLRGRCPRATKHATSSHPLGAPAKHERSCDGANLRKHPGIHSATNQNEPRGLAPVCGGQPSTTTHDHTATRRRRRATPSMPASPVTMSVMLAGSGVDTTGGAADAYSRKARSSFGYPFTYGEVSMPPL